jgi:hypothetical protein
VTALRSEQSALTFSERASRLSFLRFTDGGNYLLLWYRRTRSTHAIWPADAGELGLWYASAPKALAGSALD